MDVETALKWVLSAAHLRMISELMAAERPRDGEPTPAEIIHWLRLNMPVAAVRVEELVHPAD